MKPRRAYRLAQRSRGDGRWARAALRRLVRAGDDGDPVVTDVLWLEWFRRADAEVWAALHRWRRPNSAGGLSVVALGEPASAADVIEAVRMTGHPVAAIARDRILAGHQDLVDATCAAALTDESLAAFCVEHHLAPADPHRAAEFFLLTGQRDQYRLADPDHSLLAVTYRGAEEDQRARIRARVAGEPDLVRVLAETNRRDRMTRLSEPEAAYLTGQLADRRDWPGLWALASDLPIGQAVEAVRLIEDWTPPAADAPVFHAIARADPASIAPARAALVTPWSTRVAAPDDPIDGAFAPDGTRFAVAHESGVDVYALPSGAHEPANSRPGEGIETVLVGEDALVVTAGATFFTGQKKTHWGAGFLERGGGGRPVSKKIVPGEIYALARRPGGYAALTHNRGRVWLRLQDDDGRQGAMPDSRTVSFDSATFPPDPEGRLLACDGTRIAVAADRLYLLSVSGTMVRVESTLTPFTPGWVVSVAMSGPDRLVAMDGDGTLRVWHLAGGSPRVVAQRRFEGYTVGMTLVDLPEAGVVAVAGDGVSDPVRVLDGDTLADIAGPPLFAGLPVDCVFGMPEGTLLAGAGPGFVDVVDVGGHAIAGVADRPLAAATPADLHAVVRHLDRTAPDTPGRVVVELLRVCLEHRFGADVALGSGVASGAMADDIALGGA